MLSVFPDRRKQPFEHERRHLFSQRATLGEPFPSIRFPASGRLLRHVGAPPLFWCLGSRFSSCSRAPLRARRVVARGDRSSPGRPGSHLEAAALSSLRGGCLGFFIAGGF